MMTITLGIVISYIILVGIYLIVAAGIIVVVTLSNIFEDVVQAIFQGKEK